MRTFKLKILPAAPEAQKKSTTWRGALIIEAVDEQSARLLAQLNYSIAIERDHHTQKICPMIWGDGSASSCEEVALVNPDSIRPRRKFEDLDLAPSYVDQMALESDGRTVARMIWWPCSSNDLCPV